MAELYRPSFFQPDNINGVPLAGALLNFYQATTTTPITVYQDNGLTTPHANPVVADASGIFAPIYLGVTSYKTVLKTSAGVTVQTVDNIFLSNLPPTNDGAALGSASIMWSDLFLASGAVINFNNGDVTVTHSSNTLAFAGASSGYLFDAPVSGTVTLATPQASTSGTSIDFTSIPSWAKQITVSLSGVSTNGTSTVIIQLGDSGGAENTGYDGGIGGVSGGSTAFNSNQTAGFQLPVLASNATRSGSITFTLLDASTFTWAASGVISDNTNTVIAFIGGSKSLSAALDRVRITTAGGTDTFDAGKINIAYS